jgi:aubergine-like protein
LLRKQYGINIADHHQPLLINRPKKIKISQPGAAPRAPEIICLIPELCYLTGMSEDYKNDITIKKV